MCISQYTYDLTYSLIKCISDVGYNVLFSRIIRIKLLMLITHWAYIYHTLRMLSLFPNNPCIQQLSMSANLLKWILEHLEPLWIHFEKAPCIFSFNLIASLHILKGIGSILAWSQQPHYGLLASYFHQLDCSIMNSIFLNPLLWALNVDITFASTNLL